MTTPPTPPSASSEPPIQPRVRVQYQPDRGPLIERVGGVEVVKRFINDFYDRVEQDELLRPMFPEDMTEGRERQALFFIQWLGGEPGYSERYGHPRLRRRHFPFVIDERAAGRWLHHMTSAIRAAGIAEQELQEILAGLAPLARHMVNADEDVPREPMSGAFLT